jgi:hypothetical protein
MPKETVKLSVIAKKIYDLTNTNDIYQNVYNWFWFNEKCRHIDDIEAMSADILKLDKIIKNVNRSTIDVQTAEAMKMFLEEEMGRHEKELSNIGARLSDGRLDFSGVSSIPAIRVDVE